MTLHDSSVRDLTPALTGRLALSCAILLSVMLMALVTTGAYAAAAYGSAALQPLIAAWLLCSGSALAALLISARFASTPYALPVHLGSMLLRMGVPLIGLLVLPRLIPALTGPELVYALIPIYPVGLITETLLSMRHVSPSPLVAMAGKTLKA